MILPMKKYAFFVYQPEYSAFLRQLRELGVLHVKEQRSTKEEQQFTENIEEQQRITKLQQRLTVIRNSHKLEPNTSPEHLPTLEGLPQRAEGYDSFLQSLKEIDEEATTLAAQQAERQLLMKELEVWGDFDLQLLQKLRTAGYYLHFFLIPTRQYQEAWEEAYNAQVISAEGRYTYFITVTQQPEAPQLPEAELQKLPTKSLSLLEVEYNTAEERLQLLQSSRLYLAHHAECLEAQKVALQNRYNMRNAEYQAERLYDDQLVILEGWLPAEDAPKLETALAESGTAYTELEIGEGEDVPIKLRNNRFSRAFQPIVELFSLPNYYELDPTAYIAPFFMVFFGICFGDAGYGMIVLLVSTLLKRKAKPSTKDLLELCQWLGLSGLVIGFFSGSFFGIELVKVSFLQSIRSYFIDSNNMMIIALVLGFIQIIFAKYIGALKVQKQKGFRHALSNYAWPTLIVALVVMIGLPMLHMTLPVWAEYILYGIIAITVLLVLFYNSPGKNIFVNLGSGLWHTYSTASGLLGDTLSYIRLFAIGLTGAVLGQVFNTLATSVTSSLPIYVAIPLALVILVFGHGINFGLTTIGALVHPIRLIFVEYFNNSEYEGGGKAYDPLRKLKVNNE